MFMKMRVNSRPMNVLFPELATKNLKMTQLSKLSANSRRLACLQVFHKSGMWVCSCKRFSSVLSLFSSLVLEKFWLISRIWCILLKRRRRKSFFVEHPSSCKRNALSNPLLLSSVVVFSNKQWCMSPYRRVIYVNEFSPRRSTWRQRSHSYIDRWTSIQISQFPLHIEGSNIEEFLYASLPRPAPTAHSGFPPLAGSPSPEAQ